MINEGDDWPGYPVGSHETAFAIGVANAVYAQLEAVLELLFSLVTLARPSLSRILFEMLDNNDRLYLLDSNLPDEWPKEAEMLFEHFIDGYRICTENRKRIHQSRKDLVPVSLPVTRSEDDPISLSAYAALKASRSHSKSIAECASIREAADACIDITSLALTSMLHSTRFWKAPLPLRMPKGIGGQSLPRGRPSSTLDALSLEGEPAGRPDTVGGNGSQKEIGRR